MEKLRNQLDDIEQCAKEAAVSGGGGSDKGEESEGQASAASAAEPGGMANLMAEKQRIIIEELRKRFDFQFGDLERLRWAYIEIAWDISGSRCFTNVCLY